MAYYQEIDSLGRPNIISKKEGHRKKIEWIMMNNSILFTSNVSLVDNKANKNISYCGF